MNNAIDIIMTENDNTQHIVWHDDAIIKQLISYSVGCTPMRRNSTASSSTSMASKTSSPPMSLSMKSPSCSKVRFR